ncbi:hypothetical protein SS50377_20064 [Spironucleus salmonicida]|uniref:Uncharacterized protein n=1 Tax=Spironucleus salmonicida TaxID=348837 RepID=V6LXK7_9EUKA|nr:hypothetical protein SS50377_20064 [Spironucleus salmonicida]|eukprot:EST49367.1 Hypothetical protein SS50377_10292 [Spironucleus salmonicida]
MSKLPQVQQLDQSLEIQIPMKEFIPPQLKFQQVQEQIILSPKIVQSFDPLPRMRLPINQQFVLPDLPPIIQSQLQFDPSQIAQVPQMQLQIPINQYQNINFDNHHANQQNQNDKDSNQHKNTSLPDPIYPSKRIINIVNYDPMIQVEQKEQQIQSDQQTVLPKSQKKIQLKSEIIQNIDSNIEDENSLNYMIMDAQKQDFEQLGYKENFIDSINIYKQPLISQNMVSVPQINSNSLILPNERNAIIQKKPEEKINNPKSFSPSRNIYSKRNDKLQLDDNIIVDVQKSSNDNSMSQNLYRELPLNIMQHAAQSYEHDNNISNYQQQIQKNQVNDAQILIVNQEIKSLGNQYVQQNLIQQAKQQYPQEQINETSTNKYFLQNEQLKYQEQVIHPKKSVEVQQIFKQQYPCESDHNIINQKFMENMPIMQQQIQLNDYNPQFSSTQLSINQIPHNFQQIGDTQVQNQLLQQQQQSESSITQSLQYSEQQQTKQQLSQQQQQILQQNQQKQQYYHQQSQQQQPSQQLQQQLIQQQQIAQVYRNQQDQQNQQFSNNQQQDDGVIIDDNYQLLYPLNQQQDINQLQEAQFLNLQAVNVYQLKNDENIINTVLSTKKQYKDDKVQISSPSLTNKHDQLQSSVQNLIAEYIFKDSSNQQINDLSIKQNKQYQIEEQYSVSNVTKEVRQNQQEIDTFKMYQGQPYANQDSNYLTQSPSYKHLEADVQNYSKLEKKLLSIDDNTTQMNNFKQDIQHQSIQLQHQNAQIVKDNELKCYNYINLNKIIQQSDCIHNNITSTISRQVDKATKYENGIPNFQISNLVQRVQNNQDQKQEYQSFDIVNADMKLQYQKDRDVEQSSYLSANQIDIVKNTNQYQPNDTISFNYDEFIIIKDGKINSEHNKNDQQLPTFDKQNQNQKLENQQQFISTEITQQQEHQSQYLDQLSSSDINVKNDDPKQNLKNDKYFIQKENYEIQDTISKKKSFAVQYGDNQALKIHCDFNQQQDIVHSPTIKKNLKVQQTNSQVKNVQQQKNKSNENTEVLVIAPIKQKKKNKQTSFNEPDYQYPSIDKKDKKQFYSQEVQEQQDYQNVLSEKYQIINQVSQFAYKKQEQVVSKDLNFNNITFAKQNNNIFTDDSIQFNEFLASKNQQYEIPCEVSSPKQPKQIIQNDSYQIKNVSQIFIKDDKQDLISNATKTDENQIAESYLNNSLDQFYSKKNLSNFIGPNNIITEQISTKNNEIAKQFKLISEDSEQMNKQQVYKKSLIPLGEYNEIQCNNVIVQQYQQQQQQQQEDPVTLFASYLQQYEDEVKIQEDATILQSQCLPEQIQEKNIFLTKESSNHDYKLLNVDQKEYTQEYYHKNSIFYSNSEKNDQQNIQIMYPVTHDIIDQSSEIVSTNLVEMQQQHAQMNTTLFDNKIIKTQQIIQDDIIYPVKNLRMNNQTKGKIESVLNQDALGDSRQILINEIELKNTAINKEIQSKSKIQKGNQVFLIEPISKNVLHQNSQGNDKTGQKSQQHYQQPSSNSEESTDLIDDEQQLFCVTESTTKNTQLQENFNQQVAGNINLENSISDIDVQNIVSEIIEAPNYSTLSNKFYNNTEKKIEIGIQNAKQDNKLLVKNSGDLKYNKFTSQQLNPDTRNNTVFEDVQELYTFNTELNSQVQFQVEMTEKTNFCADQHNQKEFLVNHSKLQTLKQQGRVFQSSEVKKVIKSSDQEENYTDQNIFNETQAPKSNQIGIQHSQTKKNLLKQQSEKDHLVSAEATKIRSQHPTLILPIKNITYQAYTYPDVHYPINEIKNSEQEFNLETLACEKKKNIDNNIDVKQSIAEKIIQKQPQKQMLNEVSKFVRHLNQDNQEQEFDHFAFITKQLQKKLNSDENDEHIIMKEKYQKNSNSKEVESDFSIQNQDIVKQSSYLDDQLADVNNLHRQQSLNNDFNVSVQYLTGKNEQKDYSVNNVMMQQKQLESINDFTINTPIITQAQQQQVQIEQVFTDKYATQKYDDDQSTVQNAQVIFKENKDKENNVAYTQKIINMNDQEVCKQETILFNQTYTKPDLYEQLHVIQDSSQNQQNVDFNFNSTSAVKTNQYQNLTDSSFLVDIQSKNFKKQFSEMIYQQDIPQNEKLQCDDNSNFNQQIYVPHQHQNINSEETRTSNIVKISENYSLPQVQILKEVKQYKSDITSPRWLDTHQLIVHEESKNKIKDVQISNNYSSSSSQIIFEDIKRTKKDSLSFSFIDQTVQHKILAKEQTIHDKIIYSTNKQSQLDIPQCLQVNSNNNNTQEQNYDQIFTVIGSKDLHSQKEQSTQHNELFQEDSQFNQTQDNLEKQYINICTPENKEQKICREQSTITITGKQNNECILTSKPVLSVKQDLTQVSNQKINNTLVETEILPQKIIEIKNQYQNNNSSVQILKLQEQLFKDQLQDPKIMLLSNEQVLQQNEEAKTRRISVFSFNNDINDVKYTKINQSLQQEQQFNTKNITLKVEQSNTNHTCISDRKLFIANQYDNQSSMSENTNFLITDNQYIESSDILLKNKNRLIYHQQNDLFDQNDNSRIRKITNDLSASNSEKQKNKNFSIDNQYVYNDLQSPIHKYKQIQSTSIIENMQTLGDQKSVQIFSEINSNSPQKLSNIIQSKIPNYYQTTESAQAPKVKNKHINLEYTEFHVETPIQDLKISIKNIQNSDQDQKHTRIQNQYEQYNFSDTSSQPSSLNNSLQIQLIQRDFIANQEPQNDLINKVKSHTFKDIQATKSHDLKYQKNRFIVNNNQEFKIGRNFDATHQTLNSKKEILQGNTGGNYNIQNVLTEGQQSKFKETKNNQLIYIQKSVLNEFQDSPIYKSDVNISDNKVTDESIGLNPTSKLQQQTQTLSKINKEQQASTLTQSKHDNKIKEYISESVTTDFYVQDLNDFYDIDKIQSNEVSEYEVMNNSSILVQESIPNKVTEQFLLAKNNVINNIDIQLQEQYSIFQQGPKQIDDSNFTEFSLLPIKANNDKMQDNKMDIQQVGYYKKKQQDVREFYPKKLPLFVPQQQINSYIEPLQQNDFIYNIKENNKQTIDIQQKQDTKSSDISNLSEIMQHENQVKEPSKQIQQGIQVYSKVPQPQIQSDNQQIQHQPQIDNQNIQSVTIQQQNQDIQTSQNALYQEYIKIQDNIENYPFFTTVYEQCGKCKYKNKNDDIHIQKNNIQQPILQSEQQNDNQQLQNSQSANIINVLTYQPKLPNQELQDNICQKIIRDQIPEYENNLAEKQYQDFMDISTIIIPSNEQAQKKEHTSKEEHLENILDFQVNIASVKKIVRQQDNQQIFQKYQDHQDRILNNDKFNFNNNVEKLKLNEQVLVLPRYQRNKEHEKSLYIEEQHLIFKQNLDYTHFSTEKPSSYDTSYYSSNQEIDTVETTTISDEVQENSVSTSLSNIVKHSLESNINDTFPLDNLNETTNSSKQKSSMLNDNQSWYNLINSAQNNTPNDNNMSNGFDDLINDLNKQDMNQSIQKTDKLHKYVSYISDGQVYPDVSSHMLKRDYLNNQSDEHTVGQVIDNYKNLSSSEGQIGYDAAALLLGLM